MRDAAPSRIASSSCRSLETAIVSRRDGATAQLIAQFGGSACPVRQTFFRMDLLLLDERLASADEPGFRARQVWEWAARGAGSYDEMTNVPRELRAQLAHDVPFSSLRLVDA